MKNGNQMKEKELRGEEFVGGGSVKLNLRFFNSANNSSEVIKSLIHSKNIVKSGFG